MSNSRSRQALIAAVLVFPLSAAAQAPQPPAQVPMIIEQADADALRDIIDSTIPQRYTPALIRWFNAIFVRQQARLAELTKQAVPPKPEAVEKPVGEK